VGFFVWLVGFVFLDSTRTQDLLLSAFAFSLCRENDYSRLIAVHTGTLEVSTQGQLVT
jgi:hypothetical protein